MKFFLLVCERTMPAKNLPQGFEEAMQRGRRERERDEVRHARIRARSSSGGSSSSSSVPSGSQHVAAPGSSMAGNLHVAVPGFGLPSLAANLHVEAPGFSLPLGASPLPMWPAFGSMGSGIATFLPFGNQGPSGLGNQAPVNMFPGFPDIQGLVTLLFFFMLHFLGSGFNPALPSLPMWPSFLPQPVGQGLDTRTYFV